MDLDNYHSYEKPRAGRKLSTSSWDAERPQYVAPRAIMAPQQKKGQLQSPKPPRRRKARKGDRSRSSSSTSSTTSSSSSTSGASTSSTDSDSSDSDSDSTTTTSSATTSTTTTTTTATTSTTTSSDATFSSRSSSTSSSSAARRRKRRARRHPSLAASEKIAAAAACEALLLKERELKRLEFQLADEKRNFTRDVKRRASQQQTFDSEDQALSQMQRLVAMEGEDKIDKYVRGPTDPTLRLEDRPESCITRGMNRVSAFQEDPQEQKDVRQVVLDEQAPKQAPATLSTPVAPGQLPPLSSQPQGDDDRGGAAPRVLESTTPPLAASEEDEDSEARTNDMSPSVTGSMTPPTHSIDPIAKTTGQQKPICSPMPSEIPSASVQSVCSGPPAVVSIHRDSTRNDREELQNMVITATTTRKLSNPAVALVPRKKKIKVKRPKRKAPTEDLLPPPPPPPPPFRSIISPPLENNSGSSQPNYNSTAYLQNDPRWVEQTAQQQQLQQSQQQVQLQQQQQQTQQIFQQQQQIIRQQQLQQLQTQQQQPQQKGLQPWATMPPDWPCASPVKASKAPVPPQTLWQATSAMGPLSGQEFKSLLCSEYVPPSMAGSPSGAMLAGENSALQQSNYNSNNNNNNTSAMVNSIPPQPHVSIVPVLGGAAPGQTQQQQLPLSATDYKTPSQQRLSNADGPVGQPAPPDGRSLYEPFDEASRKPPVVKTERFVEVTDSEDEEEEGEPTPSPPPPPVAVDEDGSVMEFPPPPRFAAPDIPPCAPAPLAKGEKDGCCGGDEACGCCCPCFLRCFFCCCRKSRPKEQKKGATAPVQPLEPVLLSMGTPNPPPVGPPPQLPAPAAAPSEATLDGGGNNYNNNMMVQRNP